MPQPHLSPEPGRVTTPAPFDRDFARNLTATKGDFVRDATDSTIILQHGAATIDSANFPGWVQGLHADEPVIETYIADGSSVMALSENEPFVSSWLPLATWIDETVRAEIARYEVDLDGPAYVTASLTATDALEGLAHMDDDTFEPDRSVGLVAIVGQLAGPRIATEAIPHGTLRPMSQVVFDAGQLDAFGANALPHCRCEANQLVLFPQFGQLHAGPATQDLSHFDCPQDEPSLRQLLVYRAAVAI